MPRTELAAFGTVATGLDHPEGVAVGPDGLLYAGGEAGQVYRIQHDGSVEEIASTEGFLYGLTLDGDGNVYACDFHNAAVMRITARGDVSTYSNGTPDRPMRVPNFAAFDDDGNLYVTDSGEWADDDGVVFRVAPGGATQLWTDAAPRFPNGCCLTATGDALIVVESHRRAIVRIAIEENGGAGRPEPLVDLGGSQPDGVALADDATMLAGCYRPDRIFEISPGGRVDVFAEDPDGVVLNQPANVAFSGASLDRIVVSSLGGSSLVDAPAGRRGLALRYPKL